MCIYYKDRKNLHYAKQEHIVSAAIGGIKKLPKGYVSNEFNSGISKLEQDSLGEATYFVAAEHSSTPSENTYLHQETLNPQRSPVSPT